MMNEHPMAGLIRNLTRRDRPVAGASAGALQSENFLDSAAEARAAILDAAGDFAAKGLAIQAVNTLQQWVETEPGDLDDDESLADRLLAMFIGLVDDSKDGELSEEESEVLDVALDAAWDYLALKGVDEDDIDLLFNEWDNAVAERVRDLLASSLPDGDSAMQDELDGFVFGEQDQEPMMDAVYKNRLVVRKGKRMRIRKRVSGHVRLSAKQKMAVRKMLRKSHSASSKIKRMKSMRIRRRSGL